MKPNPKEVGQRILGIRLSMGMNQKEFARAVNASLPAVSNWETGRNIPNKLRLINIAFQGQISVDELLYGTDTNNNIMHDFIEYIEVKKDIEMILDIYTSGVNYDFAIELAESFIQTLGGNINE